MTSARVPEAKTVFRTPFGECPVRKRTQGHLNSQTTTESNKLTRYSCAALQVTGPPSRTRTSNTTVCLLASFRKPGTKQTVGKPNSCQVP